MSPAIQVQNLSKSYRVAHNNTKAENYTAPRDGLARNAQNLARETRDRRMVRQIVQGDEVEEFWAFKDITTTFKPANALGITGRTGAGKSTGLNILRRIIEPTRGRVTINGRVASLLEVGTGLHPELTGPKINFLNGATAILILAESVAIPGFCRRDAPWRRYRLESHLASASLGSKARPDFRTPKAMWSSLRIAAQATALPDLPWALSRSQKALMTGLWRQATQAGRYSTLRRSASPIFDRRVCMTSPD